MGLIADSLIEYCKPLMEPTDGSPADLQEALHLGQQCWNLAVLPDTERGPAIAELQSSMKLNDDAFAALKRDVIEPMIARHHSMFPGMGRGGNATMASLSARGAASGVGSAQVKPRPAKKYAGTGRNERCPCGSGKKYKIPLLFP